jgi:molybdopterin converting factor small subunit
LINLSRVFLDGDDRFNNGSQEEGEVEQKGGHPAMIKCVVRLFGLSHQIAERHEVEVELKDGAKLGDVIVALRREIPALEGRVIRAGENQLMKHYAFNINGRFYPDDGEIPLQKGDRIMLLTLSSGG